MIVLDASVVVELLTNGALADSSRSDLAGRDESFMVPHSIDIEVISALRRLVAGQRIGTDRTDQLLSGLAALPAERYSHTPLIGRIWELRHNFTAYDATYIALAEATNAVLYTSDEKLSKGPPRSRCAVYALTAERRVGLAKGVPNFGRCVSRAHPARIEMYPAVHEASFELLTTSRRRKPTF